jgi:hypothetical protein
MVMKFASSVFESRVMGTGLHPPLISSTWLARKRLPQ